MLCYYPKTGHTFKRPFPVLHPSITTSMLNRLNSQVNKLLYSQKILFFVSSFCFQLLIKPGGNQERKRSEVSFSLCSSLLHQDVSETSRPPSFVSVHVFPGHMWLQVCRLGSASGHAGQRQWIDEGSEVTAQEEPH